MSRNNLNIDLVINFKVTMRVRTRPGLQFVKSIGNYQENSTNYFNMADNQSTTLGPLKEQSLKLKTPNSSLVMKQSFKGLGTLSPRTAVRKQSSTFQQPKLSPSSLNKNIASFKTNQPTGKTSLKQSDKQHSFKQAVRAGLQASPKAGKLSNSNNGSDRGSPFGTRKTSICEEQKINISIPQFPKRKDGAKISEEFSPKHRQMIYRQGVSSKGSIKESRNANSGLNSIVLSGKLGGSSNGIYSCKNSASRNLTLKSQSSHFSGSNTSNSKRFSMRQEASKEKVLFAGRSRVSSGNEIFKKGSFADNDVFRSPKSKGSKSPLNKQLEKSKSVVSSLNKKQTQKHSLPGELEQQNTLEQMSTLVTTTKNGQLDTSKIQINGNNFQDSTYVDGFEFTNNSIPQHLLGTNDTNAFQCQTEGNDGSSSAQIIINDSNFCSAPVSEKRSRKKQVKTSLSPIQQETRLPTLSDLRKMNQTKLSDFNHVPVCEAFTTTSKELKAEARAIIQDGEAFVVSQKNSFFQRLEHKEINEDLMEQLLPTFEEFEDKTETIDIDDRPLYRREDIYKKHALLSRYMQEKQLEELTQKQKYYELHWKLPFTKIKKGHHKGSQPCHCMTRHTPTIYQEQIQTQTEQLISDPTLPEKPRPNPRESAQMMQSSALQQIKEFNHAQTPPLFAAQNKQLNISKHLQIMGQSLAGYMDPVCNFVLSLPPYHVDPYKADNLGFFKKMTYNDRMRENNDAIIQSLSILREISDAEQQKFQMWDTYVGTVQMILNWHIFENDEEFGRYVETVSKSYSIFNHPLQEHFQ